jgi:hypothetical protein
MSSVMDYEIQESKRFRRNKHVEEKIEDSGGEEFDEGFGAEEFEEECDAVECDAVYDENNLVPTSFSKWYDLKISRSSRMVPLPVQLPKDDNIGQRKKYTTTSHPLKWAKFTNEEEIESTMVVIGRIPMTRRKVSTAVVVDEKSGTKKKRNYAFTSKKVAKPIQSQNQFCFSITKGIECPHYSCTYIHNFSQIESCKFQDECKFARKVDDELYIRDNNGKCTKRHMYESVESYLLRLEIKIYNCTSLVLQVRPDVHSDCNILRCILESAKACRIAPLIWQKKKIVKKGKIASIGSDTDTDASDFSYGGDDEWIDTEWIDTEWIDTKLGMTFC